MFTCFAMPAGDIGYNSKIREIEIAKYRGGIHAIFFAIWRKYKQNIGIQQPDFTPYVHRAQKRERN